MYSVLRDCFVTHATTGKLVTGGPINLFTVGGPAGVNVHCIGIQGYVSVVVGNGATSVKLNMLPTVGAGNDICAAQVITSTVLGAVLSIGMDPALGIAIGSGISYATQYTQKYAPGTIQLTVTAGGTTGAIDWRMLWVPLHPLATVVAA